MDLPPPTYALLLGLTCAAWPLVLRGVPPASRRPVRLLLLATLGIEVSLALLFYSVPLCAAGVVASTVAFARVGFPDSWAATLLASLPSAIAGTAFVLQPEPESFVVYFALGFPLSLAVALAAASLRWLRWDAGWRTQAAVAASVAFAGFVPASFFSVRFGALFEVWHAPVLLAFLAGLAHLARHGEAARVRAIGALEPLDAERPRPAPPRRLSFLAGTVAVLGLVALLQATLEFARAVAPADSALEVAVLVGLSAAATACAVVATRVLGLAVARGEAARARRTPWSGPGAARGLRLGFTERVGALPSAADLERFRERLAAAGHASGALVADNADPLATLDEEAEAWLYAQRGPGRVHVVVREGRDEFVLPPPVPGEATP